MRPSKIQGEQIERLVTMQPASGKTGMEARRFNDAALPNDWRSCTWAAAAHFKNTLLDSWHNVEPTINRSNISLLGDTILIKQWKLDKYKRRASMPRREGALG